MTKPILTKREVDAERATLKAMEKFRELKSEIPKVDVGMFIDGQTCRLDFIEQAVELLKLDCTCELSSYGFHTCDNCKSKQAFLARYDGKEGE